MQTTLEAAVERTAVHRERVSRLKEARRLIGAVNDGKPAEVREANTNAAWHLLDSVIKEIDQ